MRKPTDCIDFLAELGTISASEGVRMHQIFALEDRGLSTRAMAEELDVLPERAVLAKATLASRLHAVREFDQICTMVKDGRRAWEDVKVADLPLSRRSQLGVALATQWGNNDLTLGTMLQIAHRESLSFNDHMGSKSANAVFECLKLLGADAAFCEHFKAIQKKQRASGPA